jgi:hypothetical protein
VALSRVINPDSAGKERNHLTRAIVLAIRELMKQSQPDQLSRDLAAFIALSLEEIAESIDVSVGAWEKRGYWVKAERFRMEWEWAGRSGREMRKALQTDDWAAVAKTSITVAQKLMKIQIPPRHHLGAPWVGAWEQFQKMSN